MISAGKKKSLLILEDEFEPQIAGDTIAGVLTTSTYQIGGTSCCCNKLGMWTAGSSALVPIQTDWLTFKSSITIKAGNIELHMLMT